jgi:hypothetical protein
MTEDTEHGIPLSEWEEYDNALEKLQELMDNKGRCEGCKEAIELLGKKEDDYIWIRAEEDGIHFCLDEREGE